MRTVVVAVVGMTPQIVTETLWWLARRQVPPVLPEAVHVATTAAARATIDRALCADDGALALLARDWEIPRPAVVVHVFEGPDGPLADIRTAADSRAFGVGIAELVRRLTMDPEVALHASIAGGRKTMGFHLGHILSLLGRPQDRLSHVLVPPEYEECPDFWYPTPRPTPVANRRGVSLDAAEARVELADIPFVRLRGRLTARELHAAITDPAPLFASAQEAVESDGFEARIGLQIDAVLPRAAARAAPPDGGWLAGALAAIPPGGSLALRFSTRTQADPPLTVAIDCIGQAATAEAAQDAAHAVARDVLHLLDVERTGHLVRAADAEAMTIRHRDWVARIVPVGITLADASRPRLGFAGHDREHVGIVVDAPPAATRPAELPLRALVDAGVPIDLCWSIAPMRLAEAARGVVAQARERLALAQRTASGDVRFGETVLSQGAAVAARAALDAWAHEPLGFRVGLVVRAPAPLPPALLAELGAAAFGGREVRLEPGGGAAADAPAAPLNLTDHFCARLPVPFGVPSVATLLGAGVPAAWPPAPRGAASSGVALGRSGGRSVRLADGDRARHLYAVGATGTGKSTLLRSLILQDIESGAGVFVLDPHGDLFTDLLRCVPRARTDDVIALDAGDLDHPFGLNFLEVDSARRELSAMFAVNEFLGIFQRLYQAVPDSIGPAFEQYFRLVLLLLVEGSPPDRAPSLLDVPRVFADEEFRGSLRRRCDNPAVDEMLAMATQTHGEQSWKNFGPYINNKLNRITLNASIRNICCQPRSTVDFRAAMDNGRIVLVKLPRGELPELDVRLLGMLLVGRLFGAALGRGRVAPAKRLPMRVYLDEFQNFVTETAGQMLAEGRKYGLSLVLANQTLAQLDGRLRQIVLGNTANLLAFRTGPLDAGMLEPFFAPVLTVRELQALPDFHCAARILSAGTPVAPFVLATEPPGEPLHARALPEDLLTRSRARHARPRAEVEAEFAARWR